MDLSFAPIEDMWLGAYKLKVLLKKSFLSFLFLLTLVASGFFDLLVSRLYCLALILTLTLVTPFAFTLFAMQLCYDTLRTMS